MRTFIIGVILAIETSHDFIRFKDVGVGIEESILVLVFLLVGAVLAVAQDIKELRR